MFDHKQWLSSLKEKYPGIEIPQEAEAGWMRQSDYDSNFNKLKQDHAERMKKEDLFHDALKQKEDKLRLMEQLEGQFGPAENWSEALTQAINAQHPELTEPDAVPAAQLQKFLSESLSPFAQKIELLEKQIEKTGIGAAVMIDFAAEAPDYWRETYKEKFPKKEFSEFFNKSNLTDPKLALQLFEKPYAAKKLEKEMTEKIEAAKKEGYQSAMSKYGNVETPADQNTSGMFFKGGPNAPEIDPATGQPKPQPDSSPSREEQKARVGNAFVKALSQAERGGTPNQ